MHDIFSRLELGKTVVCWENPRDALRLFGCSGAINTAKTVCVDCGKARTDSRPNIVDTLTPFATSKLTGRKYAARPQEWKAEHEKTKIRKFGIGTRSLGARWKRFWLDH